MVLEKITVLLATSILLAAASAPAIGAEDENFPRHINPARIQGESPPPEALFRIYSGALSNMATEDWNSALKNFDLAGRAYLTEDMGPILANLNSEGKNFTRWLKRTSTNIENAESLIDRLMLEKASKEFEDARFSLAKSKLLAQNTRSYIRELTDRFGVGVPSSIEQGMDNVRELMKIYSREIENRAKVIENEGGGLWGENLKGTELTLNLGRKKAVPGSEIEIGGALETGKGRPLPEKTVNIYISGKKVAGVETGSRGRYSSTLTVPSIYRKSVLVHSVYFPSDADRENYAPSSSRFAELLLRYETPTLKVKIPSRAYPGRNVLVKGSLALDGKVVQGVPVKAEWMGEKSMVETGTEGSFSFELSVSPEAPLGTEKLKLKSMPKGDIGPEKVVRTVSVVKMPSDISVTDPGISLLGKKVTIEGEIRSGGTKLKGSKIVLKMGGEEVSTTASRGGKFEITIGETLFNLSGQQDYSIRAYPQHPWIGTSTARGKILFLNPLTITVTLILLACALLYWRSGEGEEPVGTREAGKAGEKPVEERGKEMEGIKGYFFDAVSAVAGATGLRLKMHQTIREYLYMVRGKIGRVYEPFRRLSLKFEEYLYSDHRVEEDHSLLEKVLDRIGGSEE